MKLILREYKLLLKKNKSSTNHLRKIKSKKISSCHSRLKEDPYELLGITKNSTFKAIRHAYINKMKLMHPDVNPHTDTTKAASKLNIAYEALISEFKNNLNQFCI